jgi:hypothetical protein
MKVTLIYSSVNQQNNLSPLNCVSIKVYSTKLMEVIATDFQYTTYNCKVTLKVYVAMLLEVVPNK